MPDEPVQLSLASSADGVQIDSDAGQLEVSSEAQPGTVTVVAAAVSDAQLTSQLDIELIHSEPDDSGDGTDPDSGDDPDGNQEEGADPDSGEGDGGDGDTQDPDDGSQDEDGDSGDGTDPDSGDDPVLNDDDGDKTGS
jgi:hypothetical protein